MVFFQWPLVCRRIDLKKKENFSQILQSVFLPLVEKFYGYCWETPRLDVECCAALTSKKFIGLGFATRARSDQEIFILREEKSYPLQCWWWLGSLSGRSLAAWLRWLVGLVVHQPSHQWFDFPIKRQENLAPKPRPSRPKIDIEYVVYRWTAAQFFLKKPTSCAWNSKTFSRQL